MNEAIKEQQLRLQAINAQAYLMLNRQEAQVLGDLIEHLDQATEAGRSLKIKLGALADAIPKPQPQPQPEERKLWIVYGVEVWHCICREFGDARDKRHARWLVVDRDFPYDNDGDYIEVWLGIDAFVEERPAREKQVAIARHRLLQAEGTLDEARRALSQARA